MPEDLGVNVSDGIKVTLNTKGLDSIFKNPMNDPKVAGMLPVFSLDMLQKIAPLALQYSKEQGKPVVLIVHAKD